MQRALVAEVAREERRTSQLSSKVLEMRPALQSYAANVKELQARAWHA